MRKTLSFFFTVVTALGLLLVSSGQASAATGGGCSAWNHGVQACISAQNLTGKTIVLPDGYSRMVGSTVPCVIAVGYQWEADPYAHIGDPQSCSPGHKTYRAGVARHGWYYSIMYVFINGKLALKVTSPRVYV
jgi:hypothetical protein